MLVKQTNNKHSVQNGKIIMTKKILLSSLIASTLLLSSHANAADTTGTANFNLVHPITVSETTPLELGDIDISSTGSCEFTSAGVQQGSNCLATGATQVVGSFAITGKDGGVTVTLSGADVSVAGVTFTPTASTVDIAGNVATMTVGGKVDVVAGTAEEASHALSYTVNVVY